MMTPQQLMDLPYAGMAEKQLRKYAMWRKTPMEIIKESIDGAENAIDEAQQYINDAYSALYKLEDNN